jgi:WD40 repeat protein
MDTLNLLLPMLLAPLVVPPGPHCTLLATPANDVRAVAVAPDGSLVAAATSDRQVRVWELPARKQWVACKLAAPVSEIAFAPDGRRLATLSSGLELWDVRQSERLRTLRDISAFQMAYAADGTLAVAGHRLRLLAAETLNVGPAAAEQAGWLNTCVAFSRDGALVAAGDTAGNLWVWDAATGALRLRRKGHDNRLTGVGFIDGGRTILSGGSDGRLKFWDLKSGREVGVLFPHASAGLGRGIGALACAPDGRTIATGGADDGRIRLWEAATARLRATLTLPGANITSLSIALGGSTLAAGGKRNGAGLVAAWQLYAPGSNLTTPSPTLWNELGGDSPAAYRAILSVAAHPHEAVALLRQQLHPVKLDATVRKQCDALIGRLDHERFDERDAAQRKLEAMSPWVEPYLKQAVANARTLELQRRLQSLIAKVGQSTLPLLRAIEALEHATGPEARQLLRQLADGEPTARITHEARQALDRAEKH